MCDPAACKLLPCKGRSVPSENQRIFVHPLYLRDAACLSVGGNKIKKIKKSKYILGLCSVWILCFLYAFISNSPKYLSPLILRHFYVHMHEVRDINYLSRLLWLCHSVEIHNEIQEFSSPSC